MNNKLGLPLITGKVYVLMIINAGASYPQIDGYEPAKLQDLEVGCYREAAAPAQFLHFSQSG